MKAKTDENMKILGQAIRRRRKSLGLTQRQLADFAGCGSVYIHMLESGKPTIRIDKLLVVLKILGLGFMLIESKDSLTVDKRIS